MSKISRRLGLSAGTAITTVLLLTAAACGNSSTGDGGSTAASPAGIAPSAADPSNSASPTAPSSDAAPASETAPSSAPAPVAAEKVTIKVGDRPGDVAKPEQRVFDDQVAAFEKANPNIDVVPEQTRYEQKTWEAMLAGGTMPDTLLVPFTEIQSLAANAQVADLTPELTASGLQAKLNPDLVKLATADGKVYGIPNQAYAIGLWYNRDLFTKAGLDPDKPPTTWDEVRTAAKQIADKTGAIGMDFPTADNAGGWMFTTMAYSFGGSIENADGTEATITDPNNAIALQTLKDMWWTDKSMGGKVVVKWDDWQKTFAAGKVGMHLGAADFYSAFVSNYKMPKETVGMAALPQGPNSKGTLSGGSFVIVNPTASDAQKAAVTKWAEFYYLGRWVNKGQAVAKAKAQNEKDVAVGLPLIAPINSANLEEVNSWIEPYVNIEAENFAHFVDSPVNAKLNPEPPAKAQDVYGKLDAMLQKQFSDQNADPKALLEGVNTEVAGLLER